MKKHLEYTDAKSNKFWEIELKGKSINFVMVELVLKILLNKVNLFLLQI